MQKRLFPSSFFMSKLSKSTASIARHGCPESRFCRSTQFLSALSRHQGVSAQSAQSLRASELMIIMMESPRSPDPSPNFDTRHGTVSVQGSSSNLIAFWHFAPWPSIVVTGLRTAEYRPYSERTPNTEACILIPVSRINTLVRKHHKCNDAVRLQTSIVEVSCTCEHFLRFLWTG